MKSHIFQPRRLKPHPHFKHALSRAKSRYGVGFVTVQKIERMIQDGQGILRSLRQSQTRMLYEVELDGNVYYAVYSKSTMHLVTMLPVGRGRELLGDTGPKCVCGAWLITVRGQEECPIHKQELLEVQ